MDVSCGTDPIDETELDNTTKQRWFVGLHPGLEGKAGHSKEESYRAEIVQEGRNVQRFEEMDDDLKAFTVEVSPEDVLPDDGMKRRYTKTNSFVDSMTDFVVWKDSYGRDRRIRRDSLTGQRILALSARGTVANTIERQIASYDDI